MLKTCKKGSKKNSKWPQMAKKSQNPPRKNSKSQENVKKSLKIKIRMPIDWYKKKSLEGNFFSCSQFPDKQHWLTLSTQILGGKSYYGKNWIRTNLRHRKDKHSISLIGRKNSWEKTEWNVHFHSSWLRGKCDLISAGKHSEGLNLSHLRYPPPAAVSSSGWSPLCWVTMEIRKPVGSHLRTLSHPEIDE